MSLFKFIFNHRSWRISKAAKFGKKEHKYGRLIAIPIIISLIFNLNHQDWINTALSGLIFLCWIIYIISHTLEKKFYGHHGPRG